MSDRRRGLGRGLGALIPAAPTGERPGVSASGTPTAPTANPILTAERGVAAAKVTTLSSVSHETEDVSSNGSLDTLQAPVGAHFAELPLDAITPNPRQPREIFDEDALAELVTSIKEVGLLQPVVVRQVATGRYELIMGERRFRACREAGLETIPAIVRATEDEKLLLDALLENLHRAQLNPLEEAAAYDQLLKDFNCTHDQLADRIGRSRPQVSNTLRLLKLSPSVQRRVAAGVLSAGHARALLAVDDSEEQDRLAHRIVSTMRFRRYRRNAKSGPCSGTRRARPALPVDRSDTDPPGSRLSLPRRRSRRPEGSSEGPVPRPGRGSRECVQGLPSKRTRQ